MFNDNRFNNVKIACKNRLLDLLGNQIETVFAKKTTIATTSVDSQREYAIMSVRMKSIMMMPVDTSDRTTSKDAVMSRIKSLPVKETHIQQAFVTWARQSIDPRIEWLYGIINSGRRTQQAAQRAKAEGLLSGVADLHLPYPNGQDPGLFIEFKTKSGKQSDTQRQFQQYCDWVEYPYVIVRSPDQAVYAVEDYLSKDSRQLPPPPWTINNNRNNYYNHS